MGDEVLDGEELVRDVGYVLVEDLEQGGDGVWPADPVSNESKQVLELLHDTCRSRQFGGWMRSRLIERRNRRDTGTDTKKWVHGEKELQSLKRIDSTRQGGSGAEASALPQGEHTTPEQWDRVRRVSSSDVPQHGGEDVVPRAGTLA